MARKNPYEEKILERLRIIHAEETMLYEILKDFQNMRKKKGETK